ncbi:HD-GYP domain-containing protein [Deinococcus roseus]|uniref:HD-GYP domain-containing protein n=1 Tax=Deinococcus roseus TaxID=392414 RepID=A0ABQ2D9B7_9DEIO|nr:HD-GYP domain-containing protein [Deinococcus roseus]GGJ49432.1 hypothetical protein GCM10008938_39250 [Deinococcus roseus]
MMTSHQMILFTDLLMSGKPRTRLIIMLVIGALLMLTSLLVFFTTGTRFVYVHLMYLPVVLGAMTFGIPGGLLFGLLAGLCIGPFMPLDTLTGEMQSVSGWVFRTVFFMLTGSVVGTFSALFKQRIRSAQGLAFKLAETYEQNLRTFVGLVESRDNETVGHCERVAYNAFQLGQKMGLKSEELDELYWAGLMHDLGKISVPEVILKKPGKLNDMEYALMRRHTIYGHDILQAVSPFFANIAVGVRAHHEKYDGSGYPDGLKGEDIPLYGRILAVVDVFEALTSHRTYRTPLAQQEAIQYLQEHTGSHFDPQLVPAFIQLIEKGEVMMADQEAPARTRRVPRGLVRRMERNQSGPQAGSLP